MVKYGPELEYHILPKLIESNKMHQQLTIKGILEYKIMITSKKLNKTHVDVLIHETVCINIYSIKY